MPHQCVRCNKFYEDGAKEVLKGCSCGGKLFFYIKKSKLKEMKSKVKEQNLTNEQKEKIEKDVFEIMGKEGKKDETIILDFESINVLKPGKYELDLVHMFKGDPLIFKLDDGKYMIDIAETFRRHSGEGK